MKRIRVAVARPCFSENLERTRVVGLRSTFASSDAPRTSPMMTSTRDTRGLSPCGSWRGIAELDRERHRLSLFGG